MKTPWGRELPRKRRNFRLYVAGSSPRSLRAVQAVRRLCEAEFPGQYDLEVIDIYKQPALVSRDNVVAIPTLISEARGAIRRAVGELSEAALRREGFGLAV